MSPNMNYLDLTNRLYRLGRLFWDRYRLTGHQSVQDLDRAIKLIELALNIVRPDDQQRLLCSAFLVLLLTERYQQTFEDSDLRSAFEASDMGLGLALPSFPHKEYLLGCTSVPWVSYFNHIGAIRDLQGAVNMITRASSNGSIETSHRTILMKLACFVDVRLHITRAVKNFTDRMNDTLLPTDVGSPVRPDKLRKFLTLAKLSLSRFKNPESKESLNNSIKFLRAKLAASLENIQEQKLWVELGKVYDLIYDHTKLIGDLDKAIEFLTLGLEGPTASDPEIHRPLRKLADLLATRFSIRGEIQNLDDSIKFADKALGTLNANHPAKCITLYELGVKLALRYKKKWKPDDLRRAESSWREGWECSTAPVGHRILMGKILFHHVADQQKWEEACIISQEAVELLPTLGSYASQNTDKYQNPQYFLGLASDAAAIALIAGRDPFQALRLLEIGRTILLTQMLDMRTDIANLNHADPDLSAEYISLREKRDSPFEFDPAVLINDEVFFHESRQRGRREAKEELDELLAKIRAKSGFEGFLRPPTEEQLREAAGDHSIAIINVSTYHCDAFLVTRGSITKVPLPKLRIVEIKERAKQLRGRSKFAAWGVLGWLWDTVTCPILEALGITDKPKNDKWPRVWWIPTGGLSRMPLHAAGWHFERFNETVIDRVISSYSLTIKALIYTRKTDFPHSASDALLVSMPRTAGQSPLPYVEYEVKLLKEELLPSLKLKVVELDSCAKREEVVDKMKNCKIFHFAGHGFTDPLEPSRSCLLLGDWKTSPLTVHSLWEHELRTIPRFLAYLSACSTGASNESVVIGEGVHLISACQLSGFRHVVGTLWEVNDSHCVGVADIFYQTLRDEGVTDKAVAIGLHRAVIALRNESIKSGQHRGVYQASEAEAMEPLDFVNDISSSFDASTLTNTGSQPCEEIAKGRGILSTEIVRILDDEASRAAALELESPWWELQGEVDADGEEFCGNTVRDGRNMERLPSRRPELVSDLHWVPYVHFGV
ncbi:hypothetical protein ABW19_dt0207115 [Dactylella cylindrospora]|nr:hypothetical protein ABW19_dt0207115 [Dactylella cylindrospora]